MIQKIVPTLFATTKEMLKQKNELLFFSPKIHIDICDSIFVKTKTINLNDYFYLKNSSQEIEVHLMVKNPLNYLSDCHTLHVNKVFIHREIFHTIDDFIEVKKQFNNINIEVALVLNPETQVENSLKFISQVRQVLLMSVIPGAEGQKFREDVLSKVREIKVILPNMIIQIDGGINEETGKNALQKGVDILSVGSYISSSNNPKKNYNKLLRL